jgi:para-nitrobenzyl esterase
MLSVDLTRQDEDCLYLNVWTGGLDLSERRPVIVWLHYGGFILGGAADPRFNGEMLAREGAVVVTLNYRLGRLGYLAHPWLSAESTDRTSGNFGLLDQVAALEWVQQDIAAFGGDPGCVTLMGLSAGAASTSMLMTSPLAAGLFHRAVGMSGGIFGSRRPPGVGDSLESLDEAEAAGERVVAALGARTLEDLRRLDATRVNETRLPAPPEAPKLVFAALGEAIPGPGTGAHPTIDGRLIPGDPYDAFADGRQIDVPVMTGSAGDECTGMPYFESADEFVQAAQALYGQDAAEFLQLFPAGSDAETKDSSARAMADRIFVWQNWTWARLHSRSAHSPTFYYHTSYAPPVPSDRGYLESEPGAFHTTEAFYVFGGMRTKDWPWTHKDEALSKTMRRFWLNFAASGDPSGPGLPEWPRFDPTDPVAMHFGGEVRRGPVPRREHLHFWDRYFGRPQPAGGQTP